MNILQHRAAILGSASGATQYNRTPLKVLKAIPAGFPLPLHDTMFDVAGHSDAIFSNIQSAGEDLRAFTDLNMTAEIPLEILTITPGSNLLKAFVRVPSALSINDKIYLRTTVGGGETAPAADSTNGSEAVWSDYEIVVHGSDVDADATGTHTVANTGGVSKSGGDLLNAWPAYGYGATEGTASTDRIDVTAPGDSTTVKSETFIVFRITGGGTTGRFYEYNTDRGDALRDGTDNVLAKRDGSTTNQTIQTTGGELTGNAWHGLGFSYPTFTSAPDCRIDGAAPTATLTAGVGTFTEGSGALRIMTRVGNDRVLDGRLAEYRQRWDTTPDSAWFDLEWDTYNNPGSIAEAEALVVV